MNMKHRIFLFALLFCVAGALVVESAVAQNKRTGTAAASELLIPVGARDLAMGGSTIATSSGIDAIYWNPAGLGRMKSSAEGMFSNMTYIADIGVSYGAVGASFGEFGVLGLSIKSLDFGEIPLTTEDDPENISNRFFSPTFVTIGLTYSRAVTDAISFGGTLKLISEQIAQVSASGFAIDLGVQYNRVAGIGGLSLGVAVKNVGPQMKFDGSGLYRVALSTDGRRPSQRYRGEAASAELPSLIEIGLSYGGMTSENLSYSVNGTFMNNNLYLDQYNLGGELGYSMNEFKFFGRAGMGLVPSAEEKENIFGATFGAGFNYAATGVDITIDYAYRAVEFFDANNVFSVKFGF
jgi:hypothetical protein